MVKDWSVMRETRVQSLGWEDPLEKGMVGTHCSSLAWRIPRTKEPGGLQSMGSQRIRHDWSTITFTLYIFMKWRVGCMWYKNSDFCFFLKNQIIWQCQACVAAWQPLMTLWNIHFFIATVPITPYCLFSAKLCQPSYCFMNNRDGRKISHFLYIWHIDSLLLYNTCRCLSLSPWFG